MIAIQERKGSFSDYWLAYCQEHAIEFKLVDVYANDIISQINGCDGFMWHFYHGDYRDMQFAKSLILALEMRGVRCFPNTYTCWHFDDKVSQKYLLEAIGAPLVPSYVFYTETEALNWASKADFPKVFKLKGGAGSMNVKLINTSHQANKIIKRCFGKGFPQYRCHDSFFENFHKFLEGKMNIHDTVRPLYYLLKHYPTEFAHYRQNELGYAYFQDFIHNNSYDIRVVVIGKRAFAIKRLVRKNDFRASGSGHILYNRNEIPEECVHLSFDVANRLKSQCVALDYVFNDKGNPMIVEISYGYSPSGYVECPGFWTNDMTWHAGIFNPQGWMVQLLLE